MKQVQWEIYGDNGRVRSGVVERDALRVALGERDLPLDHLYTIVAGDLHMTVHGDEFETAARVSQWHADFEPETDDFGHHVGKKKAVPQFLPEPFEYEINDIFSRIRTSETNRDYYERNYGGIHED